MHTTCKLNIRQGIGFPSTMVEQSANCFSHVIPMIPPNNYSSPVTHKYIAQISVKYLSKQMRVVRPYASVKKHILPAKSRASLSACSSPSWW